MVGGVVNYMCVYSGDGGWCSELHVCIVEMAGGVVNYMCVYSGDGGWCSELHVCI